MRPIDADALKRTCVGITDAQDNFYGSSDVVFADDVDNAPTIDAVEVVWCKDCKSYDHGCCVVMRYAGDDSIISMKPDDFCSYGKVRE